MDVVVHLGVKKNPSKRVGENLRSGEVVEVVKKLVVDDGRERLLVRREGEGVPLGWVSNKTKKGKILLLPVDQLADADAAVNSSQPASQASEAATSAAAASGTTLPATSTQQTDSSQTAAAAAASDTTLAATDAARATTQMEEIIDKYFDQFKGNGERFGQVEMKKLEEFLKKNKIDKRALRKLKQKFKDAIQFHKKSGKDFLSKSNFKKMWKMWEKSGIKEEILLELGRLVQIFDTEIYVKSYIWKHLVKNEKVFMTEEPPSVEEDPPQVSISDFIIPPWLEEVTTASSLLEKFIMARSAVVISKDYDQGGHDGWTHILNVDGRFGWVKTMELDKISSKFQHMHSVWKKQLAQENDENTFLKQW